MRSNGILFKNYRYLNVFRCIYFRQTTTLFCLLILSANVAIAELAVQEHHCHKNILQVVANSTNEVPENVRLQMAKPSSERIDSIVVNFKNNVPIDYQPQTINLSGGAQIPWRLVDERSGMGEILDSESKAKRRSLLETYFSKIEKLRKGDAVVYDEVVLDSTMNEVLVRRTFRLGNFLGAGNSVHVFEIADQPGRAIRIPFTKPRPHLKWFIGTETYSQKAPHIPGIKRVALYESHADFTVVDLVTGHDASESYLKRLQEGEFGDPLYSAIVIKLRQAGKNEEAEKLKKLITALVESRSLGAISGKSILDYTRQFTYDEISKEWILTDWE